MAELIEMDFWGWLIATILLIIWGVKAYRSSKGSFTPKTQKQMEEEQREMDEWLENYKKKWEEEYGSWPF